MVSLSQLESMIESDEKIKSANKKHFGILIDYIKDQTKYISNADRKNISVGDYLNKYSFTSQNSYNLLKNSAF